MDTLKTIALVLVIIGGLNWGLVGLMNFDLVAALLGDMSLLSKIVYDLVGLAAVYIAFTSFTETEPREVNKPEQF
jgi:hypothetical protein